MIDQGQRQRLRPIRAAVAGVHTWTREQLMAAGLVGLVIECLVALAEGHQTVPRPLALIVIATLIPLNIYVFVRAIWLSSASPATRIEGTASRPRGQGGDQR